MIDEDGYRPNVGIILARDTGQVLWARRAGENSGSSLKEDKARRVARRSFISGVTGRSWIKPA